MRKKKQVDKLSKAFEENRAAQAKNAEKEAIAKSGLREADYSRKLAVKEFGYTPHFYDEGHTVTNGCLTLAAKKESTL